MSKVQDCPEFETFGADVKAAREAIGLSRRTLAEKVNIDSRYLANIELKQTLPSLPIVMQLIRICYLPAEQYFYPELSAQKDKSDIRQRVEQKLELCPEKFMPIIEGVIDGAMKMND